RSGADLPAHGGLDDSLGLELLAPALRGDRVGLLRALESHAEPAKNLRNNLLAPILFCLAQGSTVLEQFPAWVLERPTSPRALYAWALLQLQRREYALATAGFE